MKRTLAFLVLGLIGCGMPQTEKLPPMPEGNLAPAYPRSDITDPALVDVSKQIQSYINGRKSAGAIPSSVKRKYSLLPKLFYPMVLGYSSRNYDFL